MKYKLGVSIQYKGKTYTINGWRYDQSLSYYEYGLVLISEPMSKPVWVKETEI